MNKTADPAIKSYFFGKGYRDLWSTIRESWAFNWQTASNYRAVVADSLAKKEWHYALAVLFAGAALSVLIFGTAFTFVLSVLHVILLGIFFLTIYALFTITWAIDKAFLSIRSFFSVCPHCHHRSFLPSYVCPDCGRKHSHLTPSSYGILRHKCRCGAKLPATFFVGRGALKSVCAKCGESLEVEHLETRKVFISIVGAPSSGKSGFLCTATEKILKGEADFIQGGTKLFGKSSEEGFKSYLRTKGSGNPVSKTVEKTPKAFNILVEKGKSKTLLYMYDPAGEAFLDTRELTPHLYMEYLSGFVLVVDPFSFPDLKNRFAGEIEKRREFLQPSNEPMVDVLNRLLISLHNQFGLRQDRKIRIPLAVALTKVDELGLEREVGPKVLHDAARKAPNRLPEQVAEEIIRKRIKDWGGADFLNVLDTRFSNVRIFTCAPIAYSGQSKVQDHGVRVLEPLSWLLEKQLGK